MSNPTSNHAEFHSKGGPRSKVATDVILDYGQLEADFARAKKAGPDELGRFETRCKSLRQQWQQCKEDLELHDWRDLPGGVTAGKSLFGKLRTMAKSTSAEAEGTADHARAWRQRIPGGAAELATEAIHATERGQEDAPDKLDEWQDTARAQAANAVKALEEFEAKAELERLSGQSRGQSNMS